MSYIVPSKLPQKCNKCPFGLCRYSKPFGNECISNIDYKSNKVGTYGYVCNLEFEVKGRYNKILRAVIGKDIDKPSWCKLKESENEEL